MKAMVRSAAAHLTTDDLVGLFFSAALLAPLTARMMGLDVPLPFGYHPFALFLVMCGVIVIIYLSVIKARDDLTLERLLWLAALLLPCSIIFGVIIRYRTDAFFTEESLYSATACLLALSLMGALLKRRAAKGTPSDVLATATSSIAAVTMVLFWILTAVNLQPVAAIFMLLCGVLVMMTMLLRLPEAVIPIYRSRRRGRGRARRLARRLWRRGQPSEG